MFPEVNSLIKMPGKTFMGKRGIQFAICAGAAIGLTYGKDLAQACEIGAHLASSVIVTAENVCPRFRPRELGLNIDVRED